MVRRGPNPDVALTAGCEIVYTPPNRVVRRRVGSVLFPQSGHTAFNFGLRVHDVQAERASLVGRHLCERPIPTRESYSVLKSVLDRLPVPVMCRWSPQQVIDSRASLRKRRYARGFQQLYARGLRHKHSNVTMMLKREFASVDKLAVKEDRAIQYRSPIYNAALSRYLVPFEHWFLGCTDSANRGFPIVLKGVNMTAMANLVWAAWRMVEEPMAILLDHARFDSSITTGHLNTEHEFYMRAFPGDKRLKQLLWWQRKNRGRTLGGIRYKVTGKRMSGDVNTGLGNSAINYALMRALFPDAIIFVNGDDTIVILTKCPIDDGALVDKCAEFGFNTDVQYAWRYQDIDFCQVKLAMLSTGPEFLPNPHKLLENLVITPNRVPDSQKLGLLRMKAISAYMLYYNLPGIDNWLWELITHIDARPIYESGSAKQELHRLAVRRLEPPTGDPSDEATYRVIWGDWTFPDIPLPAACKYKHPASQVGKIPEILFEPSTHNLERDTLQTHKVRWVVRTPLRYENEKVNYTVHDDCY